MSDLTPIVNLPQFHAGHLAVLREAKRMNFLVAGRGWRKSTLAVRLAFKAMSEKRNVLWTSPEEDHFNNVINDQWLTVFGEKFWKAYYIKGERLFQPPGMGWMQFRPLNKTSGSHGATPGLILCDEMGFLNTGKYAEVLKPMLSKDPRCVFWGFGTPHPINPLNDFWKYCTLDTDLPEYARYANWQVPVVGATIDENDVMHRAPSPYENSEKSYEELEQEWLETEPSERNMFRIQMLVQFIQQHGNSIQNVDKTCCLFAEKGEIEGEYFKHGGVTRASTTGWYQGGADIAYSPTGDWTVIVVIDRHTMEQVYFRRFRPKANTPAGLQAQVHNALIRAYKLFPCKWYLDCTSIGYLAPEAMRLAGCGSVEGVNLGGANRIKAELVGHLQDIVEDGKIKFFNLPYIVRELKGLQRLEEDNKIIYQAGKAAKDERGDPLHDDIPIACALSVQGVNPLRSVVVAATGTVPRPAPDHISTMAW